MREGHEGPHAYPYTPSEIEALIAAAVAKAVADEREACAALVDAYQPSCADPECLGDRDQIAAQIRARG